MAKALLPSQCDILHQHFEPSECCLCKANQQVKKLEKELALIRQHIPEDWEEMRQRIIEILVKPLKLPYQEDAAEMMVQGEIKKAEEICQLITPKVKLPENPHQETYGMEYAWYCAVRDYKQQVKETLEKAGVGVENGNN